MAYTFGEGSALSPKMSFDMDAQIYKGLNMAAQQERAKLAALSKKMSDAKLIDITGSNIHPLLRQDAQQNLTEGTAAMFTAAKSGQDPRGIGYQYQQRAENLTADSDRLYNYEKSSSKDFLVDPNIQAALRVGSKEGIDKALEAYDERIRPYLDPRLNPSPIRKRSIEDELSKDFSFDLTSGDYVPGPVQSFNGKDYQTAQLRPEVQESTAIRYASDPEIQFNILADKKYRAEYDSFYKSAIENKMTDEQAQSYALVETIKSHMPTKALTDNSIKFPGSEGLKPTSSNIGIVNLQRTKGTSTVTAPFSFGLATNIPLGTATTIPKAGLIKTIGDYDPDAKGFITAKSGMLSQMPIAQQNITITREGGEKYTIKAGDALDDEQIAALKKTGVNPSAVKYQPVAVYEYEVPAPDPNNPSRTIQMKKYAIGKVQPGATNEMFSSQDISKGVASSYYQMHQKEADKLTKEYEATIKQRLAEEKQAKATAAPVATTPTVPQQSSKTVTQSADTSKTAAPQTAKPVAQQKIATPKVPQTKTTTPTLKVNPNSPFKKKDDTKTINSPKTPTASQPALKVSPSSPILKTQPKDTVGTQKVATPSSPQVAGKGGVDSPGYNSKLDKIASNIGLKADDVRQIIYHESKNNPMAMAKKKVNGNWVDDPDGAVGLLQFTRIAREDLGVTRDQILKMSAEEQLELVDKYLERHKKKVKNIYDLSLVTIYPKAIGMSDDFVIGSEVSPKRAAEIGRQNQGINNGKPFTKGQYKAWVKKNIKPGLQVTYANSKKGLLASGMILNNNK